MNTGIQTWECSPWIRWAFFRKFFRSLMIIKLNDQICKVWSLNAAVMMWYQTSISRNASAVCKKKKKWSYISHEIEGRSSGVDIKKEQVFDHQLSVKLHPPIPPHSPPFIIPHIVPQQSPCNRVTSTTTIIRSEMLCQEFGGMAATVMPWNTKLYFKDEFIKLNQSCF